MAAVFVITLIIKEMKPTAILYMVQRCSWDFRPRTLLSSSLLLFPPPSSAFHYPAATPLSRDRLQIPPISSQPMTVHLCLCLHSTQ